MASRLEETGSIDVVIETSVEKAELALKAISMELFKKVIMRTPVKTGRARGNWNVSIGYPREYTLKGEDKSGGATVTKMAERIDKKAELGKSIYLTNNLPYIQKLEYGSSKQHNGEGMVRISLQEIRNDIPNIVKENQ